MSISGGIVNFNSDAGTTANLQLSVLGGATVNLPAVQHLKILNVTGGTVASNSLIDTASLSITGDGTVDLGSGQMIVGNSNLAAITDFIRRARNNGAWNGPGLTSSAARADAQGITTLGILLNDDNSILVRYTYTGDLDLDLDIDADDYARMDAGYATHATRYQDGDINLDGAINADDFFLIDRAFSNQSATLSTLHTTAIPEPSLMILALAAATLPVARRRRP